MIPSAPAATPSRRRFLQQLLGAGLLAATGLDALLRAEPAAPPEAFRFAFLTDLHLLKDGAQGSADGIAACLAAVEKLDPRPDFILVGGDLVNRARDLALAEAEARLDLFLRVWRDHTALPAHWIFGNHDLAGTSNPAVSPQEKLYGKELFREKLQLPQLYYGFAHKGWRFAVLDDIKPLPDRSYCGFLPDEELAFLQGELAAMARQPAFLCTHIPLVSMLPLATALAKGLNAAQADTHHSLVCANADAATGLFPGHEVRAVLCGHLHRFEQLQVGGVQYINSGAVCGNYWNGPMYDCPEGFGIVDAGADGSVRFTYQTYGWQARKA